MSFKTKDVVLSADRPKTLLLQKHSDYLASYGLNKDDFEYCMTEYLRMSGIYWSLTAMELMDQSSRMPKEDIIEFITSCQDSESGGISASTGHDPHMLYTLSAVQVLAMYDRLDAIDIDGVVRFVVSMQQDDGSFFGDKWGEVDTRFSFCAVMTLSLLHRLDAINVSKTVDFVLSCMNFDGGFGSKPGSESHAGLIYCCVGTLSICKRMDALKADELAWWLCERQLPSGGLNGRPEKLPDLCYSWWVMASLSMLNRIHWVDKDNLEQYILACQDAETGGFSDRPGDIPDPFHTLFVYIYIIYYTDLFYSIQDIEPEYDFIIVGSGTAGSLIAHRLATETNHTFIVLEAGGNSNPLFEIPIFGPLLHGSVYDWQYETVRQDNACHAMVGNKCKHIQGRILGGSAKLNNMIHVKGTISHYVHWFHGKYSEQYIKEQFNFIENNVLQLNKLQFSSELSSNILKAAEELGYGTIKNDFKVGFGEPILSQVKGPYTTPGCEAIGFISTKNSTQPDIEFMVLPVGISSDKGSHLRKSFMLKEDVWNNYFSKVFDKHAITVLATLLHPKSRGEVRIHSKDPYTPPSIDPKYLSNKEDVNTLIEAVKFINKLVKTEAMVSSGAYLNDIPFPGCQQHEFFSNSYLECYVRHLTLSSFHPIGTCSMGLPGTKNAVVDTSFKVIGIDNLYVVDGSVLPTLPSGNINAAIAMMANIFFDSNIKCRTNCRNEFLVSRLRYFMDEFVFKVCPSYIESF
ncbi:unnamed protein product [Colias eurytheme]|nr:unnamed protein product [Colias eurytheme]